METTVNETRDYTGWYVSVVDGLGALWGDSTGYDVAASERTWARLMESWLTETYPGATIRYRVERTDLDSRIVVEDAANACQAEDVAAIQEHMQDLYGSGDWAVLAESV